ncbi:hypothetical protein BDN70DRAFT_801158 [Pholiota conissans]|uniref:Aminoglycoside phosphotransferase domain-containing protein n=1 Tax=Pholiota conissans TaxID=109636 RepID=A0A9P5Z8N8_9AGAR|nr:hypothetical protein BDN70DRAFT_801158 [Pholiota conissans]
MTPSEQAAFEAAIISVCRAHTDAHRHDGDYRQCIPFESKYFVKYDRYEMMHSKTHTQAYIYQRARADPNAPRVPLHFFGDDKKTGYIVMEYIEMIHLPDPEKVAETVRWLSEVPAPPNFVGIGPLGEGIPCHSIFKDLKAPLRFSNAAALERYLNRVRSSIFSHCARNAVNPSPHITPLNIRHEPLIFTQPDMHPSNFGVDNTGKTILLDFGSVGLLPISLARATMFSDDALVSSAAMFLGWPSADQGYAIAKIGTILWMTSPPSLGASISP